MQSSHTPIGIEVMHEASANGINNFKQEQSNTNGFNNVPIYESPNQFDAFMSPSNSSSSAFNDPQFGTVDKISSVVSMLKGTLERKRLTNQAIEDGSFGYYHDSLNQGLETHAYEDQRNFQDPSALGFTETGVLQTIEESLMEGIMGPLNPTLMNTMSREASQSESSAAAPVVSNGFDMCDDPCISAQALSVCESSRNQMGTGKSSEDYSRTKEFIERTCDNLKEDQKKGGVIRYGSVTSAGSVGRGDPTKKRRVERSRKMAEAKGRTSTPPIPSDMQSVLKRCENLEKEVRSLKLNLSFMNRKDSEQTKQIEELEKQNQDLADEKERLLEEIERIIAETGNM